MIKKTFYPLHIINPKYCLYLLHLFILVLTVQNRKFYKRRTCKFVAKLNVVFVAKLNVVL